MGRIHRNLGKLLERERRREEAARHYELADEIEMRETVAEAKRRII